MKLKVSCVSVPRWGIQGSLAASMCSLNTFLQKKNVFHSIKWQRVSVQSQEECVALNYRSVNFTTFVHPKEELNSHWDLSMKTILCKAICSKLIVSYISLTDFHCQRGSLLVFQMLTCLSWVHVSRCVRVCRWGCSADLIPPPSSCECCSFHRVSGGEGRRVTNNYTQINDFSLPWLSWWTEKWTLHEPFHFLHLGCLVPPERMSTSAMKI